MKIELENLFVQKLKDGINLFTGAGFSTLQSPNGEKLPTEKELCCELKKKYSLADIPEDQELLYVSEFCPEQEYQEYLRERLKVKSYNPLYCYSFQCPPIFVFFIATARSQLYYTKIGVFFQYHIGKSLFLNHRTIPWFSLYKKDAVIRAVFVANPHSNKL